MKLCHFSLATLLYKHFGKLPNLMAFNVQKLFLNSQFRRNDKKFLEFLFGIPFRFLCNQTNAHQLHFFLNFENVTVLWVSRILLQFSADHKST